MDDRAPGTWGEVADAYEARYGEPLVADWHWVNPIFLTVSAAVDCDPGEPPPDRHVESIARTADVIAVMTYGIDYVIAARTAHMGAV